MLIKLLAESVKFTIDGDAVTRTNNVNELTTRGTTQAIYDEAGNSTSAKLTITDLRKNHAKYHPKEQHKS